MDFPFRKVTAGSAVAAYIATSTLRPEWSRSAFFTYYALTWTAAFVSWVVWTIFLYPKVFSSLRHLPEPKNESWYNGQWAAIRKYPSGVPQEKWAAELPNNGLIRYLGLLNQERLLITSPKALAEVLVTKNYDFVKPSTMRFGLGRILGIGLLLAEGDEHRMQRKNLMPAFAFRHVKDLYPVFWDKAREGVLAMREQILLDAAKEPVTSATAGEGGGEVETKQLGPNEAFMEVGSWASRITLDIIGVAGLGRDFGAIADPTNKLFATYNLVFKPSRGARLLDMLGLILPGWFVTRLPTRRNEDINAAAQTIRATCRELIREKKEKLSRKELTDVDILSVALESGGFSEENLVDQLMTFLAAGHETTASSMTWAIYLLATHPEVQSRLRAEIRAHLPSPDDTTTPLSPLDIDHLPYLAAVTSEVLRYFSPVPMTVRDTGVATSIQGTPVPAGTRIILCMNSVHKDPELWGADAGKFNPDRWLNGGEGGGKEEQEFNGNGGAASNYAFLTFLHGPRSCIGMNFARAEFACLLAAWVGRFEFALRYAEDADEENLEIKAGVTSRPAKGMHVRVKVLDGW